ncbi:TPA: transporter substrate-binding domain-containing protein [Legionella pneumophila]|nr:transporter substrate-binding domain-containing protein [Legionella pneumophila]HAT8583817.1 transporter substrate-binding domain-containing protein [Legionella pneumophila]
MLIRFIGLILLIHTSLIAAKPLTVGIVSYDPPFTVRAGNDHYFGFDIELMSSLCTEMNTQCQFKPMPFNQLFTQLNKGTIDLAIAAIIITDERQKQFTFSLPYLVSNARFITTSKNSITSMDDFNKKNVGVIQGSIFKQWITLKLPGISITEYPTTDQLISALNNNEVDGVLMDDFSADYWIINNQQSFTGIGEPLLIGTGYGIMAKNGSVPLIKRVNKALKKLTNNDIYITLYKKYFHTIPTH